MNELRERHDALPEPSPESVAKARARLLAHMAEPARSRRRPVFPLWGAGLAGGIAAAVLVVGVLRPVTATDPPRERPDAASASSRSTAPSLPMTPSRSTAPSQPATPSRSTAPSRATELQLRTVANAQDLAHNAAALAAAEDDPAPSPHQWAYVKSRNVQTRVDGGEWPTGSPKTTSVHEVWRRADDKRWALMEDGKLKIYNESEFEMSYPLLLSLPPDPDALLGRVNEVIKAEQDRHRAERLARLTQELGDERKARKAVENEPTLSDDYRNTWAFQFIAQGMAETVLPAKLRAAMYGAIARIPGVKYENRASDLAGRKGVTLYRIHTGYLREEVFIAPKTYAYLGFRTIVIRDHDVNGDKGKKGEIRNWGAQLEAAIVDKPGRRP
ncbi:hypothetical protein ABZ897_24000 [Nonomuraea sp. NPDC046802]|uniref:hypothetical protein n=1 Tax=Nonomuraea sp. NPDC046802 TaxID=3154919 RepID=UPI0033CAC448